MKKMLTLIFLLVVFSVCSVAGAYPRYHDWSDPSYRKHDWRPVNHAPFAWHQHRSYYAPGHYQMVRMYDRGWHDRFPGLRAYKWRDYGPGFWYRGVLIRDAVLFYNDDDELVSVGFMHHGVFMVIRDDDNGYESHDSFFFGWWRR